MNPGARRAALGALAALALSACGDDAKNAAPPPPAGDPHAGTGAMSKPGELPALPALAWTTPPGWKEGAPASAMRIAQFDVGVDSAGEPVQCIVFGGIGGSDDEHISRWTMQMGPAAKDSAVVTHSGDGATGVTRLVAKGSYTDSMRPGDPRPIPAATLLAAIVATPTGRVHVKLVGESAVVDPETARFDAFVDSLRAK